MNTFEQPDIQQKALKKALKSPRIGKHGKRKETLLKEEIFKEMQQKILEKVKVLIDAQMTIALSGNNGCPDSRTIDSLLNRVFGKPAQEIIEKIKYEVPIDPVEKAAGDKAIHDYLNRECKNCKNPFNAPKTSSL